MDTSVAKSIIDTVDKGKQIDVKILTDDDFNEIAKEYLENLKEEILSEITPFSPHDIAFTQLTVGFYMRGKGENQDSNMENLYKDMEKNGYKGDPIDIVKIRNNYISLDNRRLFIARATNTDIWAIVHDENDELDQTQKDRFKVTYYYKIKDIKDQKTWHFSKTEVDGYDRCDLSPNTWGEAAMARLESQLTVSKNIALVAMIDRGLNTTPYVTGCNRAGILSFKNEKNVCVGRYIKKE